MERFMITDRAMINRRTAIGGALVALSPLVFPGRAMAQGKAVPSDSFVLLLKGLYQPVVHGPNLGLSVVDLNDGSYSTTKIYPVRGIPGRTNRHKAIGTFPDGTVRASPGPQTSGASARIGITATAAASETTTEWRTAVPWLDSGITGVRPGSAAAVTIALRGSTTDASGCETIQTSEVIETVTA